MKKILLTLSLFIASCGSLEREIPIDYQYVSDLTNNVCVKYKIIDKKNYIVGDGEELPLLPGGPCDRMIGTTRSDFKIFQNWVRDIIKEIIQSIQNKNQITLP